MIDPYLRLIKELKHMGREAKRIAHGYQDDPPYIQGARAAVLGAWSQIDEQMPMLLTNLRAMHENVPAQDDGTPGGG